MHILLTNDDGIFAPGLMAIYKQLRQLGDVTVVAPAQPKSAASHSISLDPLTYNKVDFPDNISGYSVHGTPADCVKLAVNTIIESQIDLVISGINSGANVGVHVYYSGTVAAAMEAAFYNIPSIALSAAFEDHINFEKAAEYSVKIIAKLLPLEPGKVINVNMPPLSNKEPKGVLVVPHSVNGYHEKYSSTKNEEGQNIYTFTGCDHRDDDSSSLDTNSLSNGYITVTALHYDMTDHQKNLVLEKMDWNDLNETNQA